MQGSAGVGVFFVILLIEGGGYKTGRFWLKVMDYLKSRLVKRHLRKSLLHYYQKYQGVGCLLGKGPNFPNNTRGRVVSDLKITSWNS